MGIEERIEQLETICSDLIEKLEYAEAKYCDRFVSSKELAKIMGCSTNNIYLKVRNGDIFATKKLGSNRRIPLSQFYINEDEPIKKRKQPKKVKENVTMQERIFD